MTEYAKPDEGLVRLKINPELADKLNSLKEGELVRVIIHLAEKPKIMQAALPALTIQRLKAGARQSQKPVMQALSSGFRTDSMRKMHGFWLANLVFAEVNKVEVEELAAIPGVAAIYEDYRVAVNAERALVQNQFSWDHIGFIKAPEVWAQGYRGQGVTVAVVDTGVDLSHPELKGALGGEAPYHEGFWAEFDENGELVELSKPHDTDEHGTHVSGTVGGRNRQMRIGMAPEVTLAHGLILPGGSGTLPQVLGGLQWVAEQGFDVVNGSFGIDEKSEDLLTAVENLIQLGIFPAFAIGNSGPGVASAPANAPAAEAVGAFNAAGEVAGFSGGGVVEYANYPYGAESEKIKPDIVAPGVEITSAVPGGEYAVFNGTSMATPHLAGAVALLLSKNPELNTRQLKDLLHMNVGAYPGLANDPGAPGKDVRYGWGYLNALQAVAAAPDLRAVCFIEGYVVGDGELVEGVELKFSGSESKKLTTTAHGFYQGTLLEGKYQVTVQVQAYLAQTREITMLFGKKTISNFSLEPAPPGWIVGEVSDEVTGQWLAGVQVDTPGLPYNTLTNTEGVYKLALKEGTYSLRFSQVGYHPVIREDVQVNPDDMVELNILMRPVTD